MSAHHQKDASRQAEVGARRDAGPTGRPRLSPAKAWTCLVINQAATPGLGSVAGRRYVAGYGQLALSLAGFSLIVFWMVRAQFINGVRAAMGEPLLDPDTWAVNWGALLFGASWLWCWGTSLSLLREAERNTPPRLAVPPRVS